MLLKLYLLDHVYQIFDAILFHVSIQALCRMSFWNIIQDSIYHFNRNFLSLYAKLRVDRFRHVYGDGGICVTRTPQCGLVYKLTADAVARYKRSTGAHAIPARYVIFMFRKQK